MKRHSIVCVCVCVCVCVRACVCVCLTWMKRHSIRIVPKLPVPYPIPACRDRCRLSVPTIILTMVAQVCVACSTVILLCVCVCVWVWVCVCVCACVHACMTVLGGLPASTHPSHVGDHLWMGQEHWLIIRISSLFLLALFAVYHIAVTFLWETPIACAHTSTAISCGPLARE